MKRLAPPMIVLAFLVAAASAAESPHSAAGKTGMPVARLKAVFPELLQKLPSQLPTQKILDGPLLGNGDMAVAMGLAPERLQFWLAKNDFWQLKTGKGGPRVFGWINLEFPALRDDRNKPEELMRAEQTLADGVVATRIKSKFGEIDLSTRSWVAATENLLVVEMSLLKAAPLEARAVLNMAGLPPSADNPFPLVSSAAENAVFWGVRGFGGPRWRFQSRPPARYDCSARRAST